jgi:hypothetical protein
LGRKEMPMLLFTHSLMASALSNHITGVEYVRVVGCNWGFCPVAAPFYRPNPKMYLRVKF